MYTLDQQTWNNVETKTGFDETIRRKINQIDSEGDGVVEKAMADDQGNKISETYVSKLEPPKWKYYKALLTQTDENAPVARVLNQDEADYLGDIEWNYDGNGIYYIDLTNYSDSLELVAISLYNSSVSGIYNLKHDIEESLLDYVVIRTLLSDGSGVNGILRKTPIEIKVRQRGTPPVLLSAETNTTGDKVILTFDKEMSGYNFLNTYINITQKINGVEDGPIASAVSVEDKVVTINPSTQIEFGQVITLDYASNVIESRDYGLLQPFQNFPVVNNVIPAEV